MEVSGKRYIVYGDQWDRIKVWAIGDVHMMNNGCARKRLKRDIQEIADDPYSVWFGLGDYVDFIGLGDKRFDPEAISTAVKVKDLGRLGKAGRDMMVKEFQPIADQCMGVGIGNHELSYMKHMQQMHLGESMAEGLGAPYLGYSAFTDLVFIYSPQSKNTPKVVSEADAPKGRDRFELRVYTHHGHGYARTQGGKINKLIGFMQKFDADLSFIGHLHDQFLKPRIRLRSDKACEDLVEVPQIGMMTGTYLRTYASGSTGYGEVKAYDPAPLGAVRATVEPHNRLLQGTLSIQPSKTGAMDGLDWDVINDYLEEETEDE